MSGNKIEILHVTYDMNIGGTEQVIRNLVEGLDKNVFVSSILCIDGQIGPWGKELEATGVKHFCLSRKPGFDFSVIKQIRNLVKEHRFDIVHCHQYTPYCYGWFGSIFTGAKIIFTEHGRFYPDVSSWKRKLINPILQTGTAAITSISKATKDALVDFENFSGKKIEVIYNGIADSAKTFAGQRRDDFELKQEQVVFGTISRLDPIKNHTMMIEAFGEIVRDSPEAILMIVGDGPMRNELEALVQDLSLRNNVIFAGFQPNPRRYLAVMDVFLLPSFSEGTSMTLLEAMSFSKPSIATAVGGTPEIIEHEKSGVLIANADTQQLVEAMKDLLSNSHKRQQLGDGARLSYERRFTDVGMVASFHNLYKSLVNS